MLPHTARINCVSCDFSSSPIRNKLKIDFLEQEKSEILERITDLEFTLEINKNLIRDLCETTFTQNEKYKISIQKLNEENSKLHNILKKSSKNKADFQAQKLIFEQIIEEYKKKERELICETNEKIAELREMLDKKEYILQNEEKKYYELEQCVLKYLNDVPEMKNYIDEIKYCVKENEGISNVVIENDRLRQKISELISENEKLRADAAGSESQTLIANLKQKISSLIKENEKSRHKVESQEKQNLELYDLNEKLTDQLNNLNKQVNMLIHSQKIINTDIHHTQTCGTVYTNDALFTKKNMSFGELSSISDHVYEEQPSENFENQGDINKIEKSLGSEDLRIEIKDFQK